MYMKYPLLLSDFNSTWIFLDKFSKKKSQISNLMKIRPVGAELFHEDGQTDMTKLTITFPNFANAPKHETKYRIKNKIRILVISGGPGSSVSIATGYWLDGPGIESRWAARFSAPVHTGPGAHPASCTMGTGSFQGVKSGRGVTLSTHPLLMPWSWKGRAIPLLPLWTVRPVQSLSACTWVHFTFFIVRRQTLRWR
jgi:hypothetical protein